MLSPIIFGCIAAVVMAKQPEIVCKTCIKIDAVCQNVTYLFDFTVPFRNRIIISKMGVLRKTNELYFVYEPKIDDPEFYKLGYVNLTKPDGFGAVTSKKTVNNFGTFAIDQRNNIVYAGSTDGIYLLDYNHDASAFSNLLSTIVSIFYKGNVLYVNDDGNKNIAEKKGDLFTTYDQYRNVMNFVINNDNILVFLNSTGLYASEFKTENTVKLSKNRFIRGLEIDKTGVIYAWWVDTVYKVVFGADLEDTRLVVIADITALGALTFDNNNNMIFNSGKSLFRLTPTNATKC